MLKDREGALAALLRGVDQARSPVGTRAARSLLDAAGYRVSESSASRLLTELDDRGWTTPLARKGRVVSDMGRREAQRLEALGSAWAFADPIAVRDVADLLDLLRARRAVESAVAYDAAKNASSAAVERLRALHEGHRQAVGSDAMRDQPGLQLHRQLASMAPNRMLNVLTGVVLAGNLDRIEAVLDIIIGSHHKDAAVVDEHEAIIDAVERGDAIGAETTMRAHFDSMITTVETYIVGSNEEMLRRLLNWVESDPSALPRR